MGAWIVWVVVAVALAVGEMVTMSLFLAPFALGAVVAAGVDLAGVGAGPSVAAFFAVSLALLTFVRPRIVGHRNPPALRTGAAAIVGRSGVALTRIDVRSGSGTIKVGGEVWSAVPFDAGEVIEPGRQVDVLGIRGATALVTEGGEPWLSQ